MLPGLGAEHTDHGVGASVIPGLGTVNAGHIGATVGLLHGVVSHTVGQHHPSHDSTHQQLATRAQQDPARYGADFLLRGHNRKRYEELARAERLPSQVWAHHEATGHLEGHLRAVHERYGEQLYRLYRHRPMGERAILGLAAASGASEDVARALDALRVHHHYPARVSFPRLVRGFSSPEIARIAAAFLPGHGGSETVVEAYRAIRAAREQAHRARRRLLFRRLREQWASERPAIIPLFEGVTRGFSPAQTERLRLVLERGGDAEVVFEELEDDNLRRRLASVEAAFRRWLAEWEASHHPSAQTPLQEPHVVLDASEAIPPSRPPIVQAEAAVDPAEEVEPDHTPDSERQFVLQRGPREEDAPAEQDTDVDRSVVDEPEEIEGEAGALHGLRAPPPGAYAADGVLPWGHFTQGFGHRGEERLRRAWEGGRQWHAYREILARRGEETRVVREAAFLRHMASLGCSVRGPCRLHRRHLAVLAPLGAGFTPEQWARLEAALTEGVLDPLEVWRDVERENLAEAVSVREPGFLRYVGAWGHAPHHNPVEWARTAPRLRRLLRDEESAGLFDDQGGDVGSLGEEEDRPEVLSTDAQGIGALFGGGVGGEQGTLDALGGTLRGFAEQALGALTGRTTQNRPVADPTRSLDEAAGLIDEAAGPLGSGVEDVFSAVDKSVHALFGGSEGAPRPPGSGAVAGQLGGVAERVGLDLQRVLASWGGPQSKLGEQIVRGLAGIGLTDLAATHPSDLLRIVAGHKPSGSDPSGWWDELTAAQGLSESAEEELRKAIDADGPKGIERTIGTYVRLLKEATDAQNVLRDALFTTILENAQRVAGPTFDPTRLPGGDPFVLLSQNSDNWPRVVEAMKSGNGLLAVFRQMEDARQGRLLQVDAPEWMRRMLSALWEQRQKAGWVPDGASNKIEEAGWVSDGAGDNTEDAGAVDPAPSGGLDLPRVLASWGGPQSKLGEQIVRGLAGIGLTDLAATHPSDLLRIVAGHRPSGSDPSGWWDELTAAQGLSESAEEELRKAIDADGPKGIERTIGTYVRLLKEATDAQNALRDALFTTLLETAQRIAGPTFDPARLPGGDPFVLLSQNTGDWSRVVAAMKSGNGLLAVFQQIEKARQDRLLRVDAPAWMRRMLSALWTHRQKTGWVPDGATGTTEDAGAVAATPSGGHQGGTPSGGHQGGAPSGGHQGGAPSGGHQGGAPSGGHQGGAPSGGHQGGTPSGGHQGTPSSGHQGGAPSGGQGGMPSGGHQGTPSSGHQGGAPSSGQGGLPSGGHQGMPSGGHHGGMPSGGQGGLPSGGHQGMPSGSHQGGTPSGHTGYWPPGHQGHTPSSAPSGSWGHGHQGNAPWGHPRRWEHGPQGHTPWGPQRTWEHGHHGHSPWSHHGTWVPGQPWTMPWGHQRTWEHGYQGHSPWGHHGSWAPGQPWIMPWGHHRTWEPIRYSERHAHGHVAGETIVGALLPFPFNMLLGRKHHHMSAGKAIASTLLPFPFNMLLGHKHHREVVRYDPFSDLLRRARAIPPAPAPEVVWRAPPVREVVREPVRVIVHEPVRETVWRAPPVREVVWRAPLIPTVRREVVVNFRPRPLYHLSFGRPMSEHEFRRYLTFVPQLRAHPDGVLAEMAGLHGQARDVRGVDATTGEYLLLPGETLADIAHKLVGERRRWRELEAANPMRAEGDPRVRLPPSWFGYVPYSVPLHRLREMRHMHHHGETGDPSEEVSEAGDAQEAEDDAGFVRRRVADRASRRRPLRSYAPVPGFGSIALPEAYESPDPNGDESYADSPEAEDASGPRVVTTPRRRYRVTHFDALGKLSPTYSREVAEQIVMQHNLFDGHRLLRPAWWAELREVNPQKPLNSDGWWRDIHEGEVIWIPDSWPLARPEPGPEAADTGAVVDALDQFAPISAPPQAAKSAAANTGGRQNLTRQTYTIVRGDWPQKIAQKFGANGRAHWLSELEAANPHKSVESGIGNWVSLYAGEVVNIPDAWGSTDTGEEEDDTDAGALRQNLTTRTYSVVAGDGMQRIAQKLGAASMGRWFSELRDANPHKKMAVDSKGKQLGRESLTPGEILNIPDTWPDTPRLRPAPGGTPTHAPYPGLSQFPAFPGGAVPSPTAPPGTVPAAATVDPGTILRVQAILIAFRQVHPEAVVPKDFGTGMPFSPDATGVLTPRTQKALASFQRWSNSMAGSRLRTDGVLDPDTIAALDSFSAQAIGGLAQRPAVVPIAGAAPASGTGNPLAGILGAATATVGDFARRVSPPVAPPDGHGTDPFAGAFGSSGALPHPLERDAPPNASPAPRRSDADPRPAQPPLDELQGALQQYGIPGVPGLPGGAPHAPQPRRPRVDTPTATAPAPEEPPEDPARVAAPVAKKTSNDDSVVPFVLTGLGLLAGVFV